MGIDLGGPCDAGGGAGDGAMAATELGGVAVGAHQVLRVGVHTCLLLCVCMCVIGLGASCFSKFRFVKSCGLEGLEGNWKRVAGR